MRVCVFFFHCCCCCHVIFLLNWNRENKEIHKSSGSITFVMRISVYEYVIYLDAMTIHNRNAKNKQNYLIFHWHVLVKIDPLFKWMVHIVSSCIYMYTLYTRIHIHATNPNSTAIFTIHFYFFLDIFLAIFMLCIYCLLLYVCIINNKIQDAFWTNLVSVTAVIFCVFPLLKISVDNDDFTVVDFSPSVAAVPSSSSSYFIEGNFFC